MGVRSRAHASVGIEYRVAVGAGQRDDAIGQSLCNGNVVRDTERSTPIIAEDSPRQIDKLRQQLATVLGVTT